jgi:hypothetical protein
MIAEQLENFLTEQGFANDAIKIRDARYVFPSRDWVFRAFSKAWGQFRQPFLEDGWQAELGDCDDFADGAAFYARWLHRLDFALERKAAKELGEYPPVQVTAGAAIAFGTFEYLVGGEDPNKAHAINCAIVSEHGKAELVFFEPQAPAGRNRVDLTPEETWSCLEIRF